MNYDKLTRNDKFLLNVEVPIGTTCEINLIDGKIETIGSGKYSFACDAK